MLDYRIREGIVHGLADEDQKALYTVSRDQIVYDLMLTAATRKTIDLLAPADIPVLLLKGTPIAFQYYQAPYSELAAIQISSYERRIRTWLPRFWRQTATNYRVWTKGPTLPSNSTPCSHPGRASPCCSIFTGDSATALSSITSCNSRNIREMRRPLPELDSNAYTLSPPHLLLHACIYRIIHGRNTMRNRLIWLYDIHLSPAGSQRRISTGFSAWQSKSR